jgi:hypothetical protein
MSAHEAEWRIEGNAGQLRCGPLTGCVEADGRGVRFLAATWRGVSCEAIGALITAGPGPRPQVIEVQEQYVRGCDFVVAYARSADYPVAPQFYWRATHHPAHSAVQIEMIVSVQTDLLDSRPEASVNSFALQSRLFHASRLRADAFCEVGESKTLSRTAGGPLAEELFVFRHEPLGVSYAQLVHPSDFVAAELQLAEGRPPLVSVELFPDSLEKGVIRLARICGWFLPAENDLAVAVELAKQFLAEPLPLTA